MDALYAEASTGGSSHLPTRCDLTDIRDFDEVSTMWSAGDAEQPQAEPFVRRGSNVGAGHAGRADLPAVACMALFCPEGGRGLALKR
jgi:hypothetical protein